MDADKLIRMANQIGLFFAAQGEAGAPAGIADHLRRFWEPGMREQIIGLARNGVGGFDPLVLKAVKLLDERAVP